MHEWAALYNGKRWQRLRAAHLRAQPLCFYCGQLGRVRAATVVDHFVPHRGDLALFYLPGNLRSACKACHDGIAAVKDRTGYVPGCGLDGEPLDAGHPWCGGVEAVRGERLLSVRRGG